MTGAAPCDVTVVVTTHNRPDFAHRAVVSALGQTLAGVEVVVVDDGSEPAFVPAVDDTRLRVVRREHAGGVSSARNVGLAAARGDWITFLDDDDVLVPDMLERSLRAAGDSALPQPVAVMSAVVVLGLDGHDAEVLRPARALARGEDFHLERKGAAGRAVNSLVAPTEVIRAIGGFDEQLEVFEHDDFGLRLNAAASIVGVPEALYRMTTHREARVSARAGAIPINMERTLAKHRAAFARHPEAHARFMGRTSYYFLKADDWGGALRWGARALRRNPRDRRVWFFFAAALAGPRAHRTYRRLHPPESPVAFSTLTRRRVRKYARKLLDHPRSLVGAVGALVARPVVARCLARWSSGEPAVLVIGVYRRANAQHVAVTVREAADRGWQVRLWALDAVDPALAAVTVGEGAGPKFPLLNSLLDGVDLEPFDWVVVTDDDVRYQHGSTAGLLSVADAAGLDLVQPAHTERSHRDIDFCVRRPFAIARRTTFVEIGPIFAVARRWRDGVLPFPAEHTMGWGLELDWFELAAQGARLGIVDGVPIRHLQPVGRGYEKTTQAAQMRALVRAHGLTDIRDIRRTLSTWWSWSAAPPWIAEGARTPRDQNE